MFANKLNLGTHLRYALKVIKNKGIWVRTRGPNFQAVAKKVLRLSPPHRNEGQEGPFLLMKSYVIVLFTTKGKKKAVMNLIQNYVSGEDVSFKKLKTMKYKGAIKQ